MQFTIVREDLLKRLSAVVSVVEKRQTKPVLSNICVRAETDKVSFTGTDLEIEMVTWAAANVHTPGSTTIPARKFLDVIKALPNGCEVRCQQEGERVRIIAGRSRFSLTTLSADDYPNLEEVSWEMTFAMARSVLRRLIEKTQFCMAQQDVRYYLNGLMFETLPGSLKAVAADGHRLALCETVLPASEIVEKQIIIPRKGVMEMARLLGNEEGPLEISISTNHIRLRQDDLVFTSKLIDGRFPDYKRVVPASVRVTSILPRNEFKEMLSRVGIVSTEKYRGVRLRFEKDQLIASAHNPEQDEAIEELTLESPTEDFEVGFNVGYLIEAVSAIEGTKVELGWNDANSGCRIRVAEGETEAVYVVMPMRL